MFVIGLFTEESLVKSKNYQSKYFQIQEERDRLEEDFLFRSNQLSSIDISDQQRNQFICSAFQQVRSISPKEKKYFLGFVKTDQLMMKWYLKSIEFSSNISSKLSLIEEFYFEQMRKSAGIPKELLTYSKVDVFKKNFIVFIRSILNKNNDDQIITPLSETNFQHSNIINIDE